MTLTQCIFFVAGCGCVGGAVKSLLGGGLELWSFDSQTRIWKPGFIGNVIVGGFAAVVMWALYGPFSSTTLGGTGAIDLPLAQIAGSFLVGISGAQILTSLADKQANDVAKRELVDALKAAIATNGNRSS